MIFLADRHTKEIHKQLAISKIAKNNGMLWSAWKGLFQRNDKGKAGEFISSDLDVIASTLLGDGASAKDLGSLESILATMPNAEADALMRDLEADANWTVVRETAQLDRIITLAGL